MTKDESVIYKRKVEVFNSLNMMVGIVLFLLVSCPRYLSYPNHPSCPSYPSCPETTEVEDNQNAVEDTPEESRPSCMEDIGDPIDMKLLLRLKREVGCGVAGQG